MRKGLREKRPVRNPRGIWEDSIETYLEETEGYRVS
jgi:hypothetical protein